MRLSLYQIIMYVEKAHSCYFFRKYEMTFINLKYEEEDDVRKFYVL